jgi:hypothetical protein
MSVREKARLIEVQESSAQDTTQRPSIQTPPPTARRQRHFSFGSSLQGPTLEAPEDRPPIPSKRIIEPADLLQPDSPIGLPSRSRAKKSIFDFEEVQLDGSPRPLLPPRPTNRSEAGEDRRASDGSVTPSRIIKRNPLVDTFNALDLEHRNAANATAYAATSLKRSKSFVEPGAPEIIAQASDSDQVNDSSVVLEDKEYKASDFNPSTQALHNQDTAYEVYGAATPNTPRIQVLDSSQTFFKNFQGFVNTPPRSPKALLSGAKESFEQFGVSVVKVGEELKSMVSQIEVPVPELWLRTQDGLSVRS